MITVHIITEHFPPESGGLELWTKQFADAIIAEDWGRVIVYVAGETWPCPAGGETISTAYEVISIAPTRSLLLEPIRASGLPEGQVRKEYDRATYLCLLECVNARVLQTPTSKHVLLSNFATGVGFTAATIAESLELPHVVRLAGTDWSRGMRTSSERTALLSTLSRASHVVVLNGEQKAVLEKHISPANITRISTSINAALPPLDVPVRVPATIDIFSDCGFSHKKATHILLRAFASVAAGPYSVRLTLAGTDEQGQEAYWKAQKDYYRALLGDAVIFPGAISRSAVSDMLATCNLYCSATLGEGCSLARIGALCAGVPIVTTATGEMPDIASTASHVKLVPPGDLTAFSEAISVAVAAIVSGTLPVDLHHVQHCRAVFSPQREVRQWKDLLSSV